MEIAQEDTIFALASGAGQAAIAILRLSGPKTTEILSLMCREGVPSPRRASVRGLIDPADNELLDRALVLFFPGPHSYTGEDSAEFHVHAGAAVIQAVTDVLVNQGARPAEPGEFSRRGFLNGRFDLTEAEGVADLIAAETEAQRRQALAQAEGGLSQIYGQWSERLKKLLAWQEAMIDFPDEDLPASVEEQLVGDMLQLQQEMQSHLNDARRGERLREGLVFVITGAPNVGKSSLLNYLADRPAAIVSSQAGTTRDAIEVRCNLGGIPVTLVDTAGLRETADEIEAEGIRRAYAYIERADYVLHLIDGREQPQSLENVPSDQVVYTKIDQYSHPDHSMAISVTKGEGLDELYTHLEQKAQALIGHLAAPPLTRARHRASILKATHHLSRAVELEWPEMRGEELRLALLAIGRLTGKIGVEEILDSIFGQFCIGK